MPNLTISDIRRTLGIYSTQPITIINGGSGATLVQDVTPAATVNFDILSGSWGVIDINTNITTFNFTNITSGDSGLLYVFQTTGGHTITWGSMVNTIPASGIDLLTGAGELNVIEWSSADGVNVEVCLKGGVGTGSGPVAWADITGKPSSFAPAPHSHPISDVTNLQSSLDGKAATSHTHTKAQITDFTHTHAISDTTGLQAALDAKQATLVSGINFRSVNGTSLLGSGDLSITGINKVTINSGVNASWNYSATYMITRVVVITTGSLAAFKIGITNGGEELFPETPFDASSVNAVQLNYYASTGGTIYFNGITSSTTLILYYE